jgi:hypothetical protein
VICLKDEFSVVSVAVAFGKSRNFVSYANFAAIEKIICVDATKNASAVTQNHDLAHPVLDFVFDKSGVALSFLRKRCFPCEGRHT